MTDIEARAPASRWRQPGNTRAELGRLRTTGLLAWSASRIAGAFTGGGRVQAIDAVGLVPGMPKFYVWYFGYVNSLSRLERADSELIILRTAWNCGSYYEWVQHVYVSRLAGLTLADVERVAEGPHAADWNDKQCALLTAVDELVATRFIGDGTWAALREFYDNRQLTDLCLLVGNYAMLAMLLTSVDARVEPGVWQGPAVRWLRGGPVVEQLGNSITPGASGLSTVEPPPTPPVAGADLPGAPNVVTRLSASPQWRSADPGRIVLGALRDVGPLTWTLSRIGGFFTRAGTIAADDAIGMDPRMVRHYLPFAVKLVLGSHLTRMDTELATLRITWNSGVKYEWYYHAYFSRLSGVAPETVERVAAGPAAPGWNDRQRALLTAVDELYADRFISDATWSELRAYYDDRKLAALCLLVGHYDMIGMLFRTFGVDPEPGALRSGILAWMRRDDDSDRLPLLGRGAAYRVVSALAGRVRGVGLVSVASKVGENCRAPVFVIRDGDLVVLPLPEGDRAGWVRAVLGNGTATLHYRGSTVTLVRPHVRDRIGCDGLSLPARFAARITKVLVAESVSAGQ